MISGSLAGILLSAADSVAMVAHTSAVGSVLLHTQYRNRAGGCQACGTYPATDILQLGRATCSGSYNTVKDGADMAHGLWDLVSKQCPFEVEFCNKIKDS